MQVGMNSISQWVGDGETIVRKSTLLILEKKITFQDSCMLV